jgi:hypothetical protein
MAITTQQSLWKYLRRARRASKFKKHSNYTGRAFVSKIAPALNACPHPVPAGEGMGKTTISWNTGDDSAGKVGV